MLFLFPYTKKLQEEKEMLTKRRDAFQKTMEHLNKDYEGLKLQLQENETHAQVQGEKYVLPRALPVPNLKEMQNVAYHVHAYPEWQQSLFGAV